MKKQYPFLLIALLTSCNQPDYAKETISKPKINPAAVSFSESEKLL